MKCQKSPISRQYYLNLLHYRPDNILVHLSQKKKDFFLPELPAIFLWVSLDFQRPWHLYVYEIWLTIHYSLGSGCWLFQLSGSWASNKASTVRSLAFSEVRFGIFSFVILQPFSFKHSLSINMMNSHFFGIFCQADLIIVHWRIDKLLPLTLGEIH